MFLKKTKNRNTIQSNDTTLGYTLKEYAPGYDRATRTPMLIAALFIITKVWKYPRCPTSDEWIKNIWYIYIQQSNVQS
jgi:hypothetical protein